MIGGHRRQKIQQPAADPGIANPFRRGGQGKKWENRGDADKLKQAVEQNQSQHAKQLEASIRKRHPVTPGQQPKKGKKHGA